MVAAIATILVWTGFIVGSRAMALKSLSPWDILACRIVGASVVLLPWGLSIVRRRRAQGVDAPSWLGLSPIGFRITALTGLLGGIGYGLLAYPGFVRAPAAHAAVLMPGMLPLFTALVSAWLLHERIGALRALGIGMLIAGALLVGGPSMYAAFGGGSVWKGDLLFLCAAATWSTYAVVMRRERLDPVESTIAVTVFACVVYLPAYAVLAALGAIDSRIATSPAGEVLLQAVWQGIGSVVVSGISFTTMVRCFGPVRSTMLTAVVPGLSATGAVLFLGEPLGWHLVAGLALVTLGILVGTRAMATSSGASR